MAPPEPPNAGAEPQLGTPTERELAHLDFLNLLAHELRGPVALIRGTLSTWLSGRLGPLSPELEESARVCEARAVQLANLVSQVLLAVRMQDRNLAPHMQPTELVSWLRAETHRIAAPLGSTGHVLQMSSVSRSAPVKVDRRLLLSALHNLVDNAQKFSPEHSVISLEIRREGNLARLMVRDQGSGMPDLPRLDPFSRAASSVGLASPGMGLGLHIASGVAHVHGGTLEFRTSPSGTEVQLDLPISEDGVDA